MLAIVGSMFSYRGRHGLVLEDTNPALFGVIGVTKLAAFYGNCQARAVGQILADHGPFAEQYDVVPVSMVQELSLRERETFLRQIPTLDLLVHQPASSPRFAPINTPEVLAALRPGAESIVFPVIWFDAYGPDWFHPKNENGEAVAPFGYHSALVINAYLDGMNAEQAAALFERGGVVDDAAVADLASSGLVRLRQREATANLFVTGFIESRYRDRRLFYTFNHPTADLLFYIADKVLQRLNIPMIGHDLRHHHRDIMAEIIRYPEHVAIHASLGTKFELQRTLSTGTKTWTMAEYAARCFEAYGALSSLARQPTPYFLQ